MELQASVRFIAVPEAHSFPDAILVGAFLCGEDLHSHSWKTAWQIKTNARVNASDQELIRRKLCDQSDTMRVVGARRMASVVLRVSVRHGRLPCTEIQFLLRLADFFKRRFQFSFEVEFGNFPGHGRKQSKISRMPCRGRITEDVPAAGINPERRDSYRTFAQGQEVVLCKAVRLGDLGNQQWIIGAVIGCQNVANKAIIVAIDVRSNRVD
jgi:hypothetical protein